MFYRELQRYAAALNAATLDKDRCAEDILAVLRAMENPPTVLWSSTLPAAPDVKETRIRVGTEDAYVECLFRYDDLHVALCSGHIRFTAESTHQQWFRWSAIEENFIYGSMKTSSERRNRKRLHSFLAAIVNGF